MLRVLLAKDLRRAWRNPMPWVINLALPLCITALIGVVFGGQSNDGALVRIRFALVDEDQSALTGFLRGAVGQGEGGTYLDPVPLDRETALRELNQDRISAAVIITTNFTRNYLTARGQVKLRLVKNPAQSIQPAVLEELLGVATAALNGVARNFQSEFALVQSVLDGRQDYRAVSQVIERVGSRIEAVEDYSGLPVVWYEKKTGADEKGSGGEGSAGVASKPGGGESRSGMFSYLLIGMAGMFLIFMANTGLTDLYRELQLRTFERYQTMRQQLLPFVAGKVVFALVLLAFGSAVMLIGGGLVFGIRWRHPFELTALTAAYSCFAAGLIAVMVALMPDQRRAEVLINIVAMFLGFVGGCAFPIHGFPPFLRDHISPHLPTHWFVTAARDAQFGGTGAWEIVSLRLLALGVALIALATFLFQRRFAKGLRA
jgi:ABC-type multidrug transport system permease subunit